MKSTKNIYPILLELGICGLAAFAQTPGTFSATGKMTTPRFIHAAALLADGRVLIAGGQMIVGTGPNIGLGLSMKPLASAEIYDPSTGVFTPTGDMTTSRVGPTATLLPNGKVLIAGGASDRPFSAELYDPATGTFTATGDMIHGGIPILLRNGRVLFVGFANAELYDPSTGTFTATVDVTSDFLSNFVDGATLLPNGNVLIYRSLPYSSELYDPSTGTFTGTGSSTIFNTGGQTANLLSNGKVLFAGGGFGDGDGASYLAELYDPAIGTFAATGNMVTGREQYTATLLPDGTVLMAGGHNTIELAASAEIYDPVTGTFGTTGKLAGARELNTATLLKDGRVLIAGGDDERYWVPETILASAELYCPANVNCAPDPWQQAISAMKTSAGTDSLNFYQWAWYWQGNTPAFSGAPAGFGVVGSISPDLFGQITAAGGGDPLLNVSAEQWVSYFRQVVPQ